MLINFSLADVEAIKGTLLKTLPDVQSSHRVEALARGLGWQTNASLRAELKDGPCGRSVDDLAFKDYLSSHGFASIDDDALSEAVVEDKFKAEREAVLDVMKKDLALTHFGIGVYAPRTKTLDAINTEREEGRRMMLTPHALQEFILARDFLSQLGQRKTINKSKSSYGLKHEAEKFHRARGCADAYVSNGMLIAAAIHLGFKLMADGPNAYLNFSQLTRRSAKNAGTGNRHPEYIT